MIGTSQYLQGVMYFYFWHVGSDLLILCASSVVRWICRRKFAQGALNGWCCRVSMPSIMRDYNAKYRQSTPELLKPPPTGLWLCIQTPTMTSSGWASPAPSSWRPRSYRNPSHSAWTSTLTILLQQYSGGVVDTLKMRFEMVTRSWRLC